MQNVFNQTLTLFIVMIVGFLVAKLDIFTHDVRKKLASFLVTVAAPMLIIKNFQVDYSIDLLKNMGIAAIIAFSLIGIGLLVGKQVWRKSPEDKRPILIYATAFPNCGYLGYPVLGGLFGSEGIIYVAIFVMVFQIYMWTAGVWIYTGKPSKWYKPFMRPSLIAVFLGIVLFAFSIKLPTPIYNSLTMVGGMTSPLAMLLIGAYLADSKLKEVLQEKTIYLLSIFRFIIWPTAMFFILKPFGLGDVLYACCVLLSAMPAAANTVILATRYNKNPRFASELVAFTTVISVASIPLWMYFITGGIG